MSFMAGVLLCSNAFAWWGSSSASSNSYTYNNPATSYESASNNYNKQNWFSSAISNAWNSVKSFAVKSYQWVGDKIDSFRGIDTHKSFTMNDGTELVGRIKTDRNGEITYIEPGTMRHIGEEPIKIDNKYYKNGTLKYENNKWVKNDAKVVSAQKAKLHETIK